MESTKPSKDGFNLKRWLSEWNIIKTDENGVDRIQAAKNAVKTFFTQKIPELVKKAGTYIRRNPGKSIIGAALSIGGLVVLCTVPGALPAALITGTLLTGAYLGYRAYRKHYPPSVGTQTDADLTKPVEKNSSNASKGGSTIPVDRGEKWVGKGKNGELNITEGTQTDPLNNPAFTNP